MRFSFLHRMKILVGLVFVSCAAVAQAGGRTETDDFDLLPNGGFNNPFFVHDVQSNEFDPGSTPEHEFHQTNPDSDSGLFGLEILTGTDFVSFLLDEGEFVDFASVFMRSSSQFNPATFHVVGVNDAGQRLDLFINTSSGADWNQWVKVDSSAAAFARITQIRLTGSAKGFFDDLTVNVVPEPATWVLMAMSMVGLVWIRRRRTAH